MRLPDALIQVTLLTGAEEWVYIHVEVQGEREAGFARRMFTYNYRLYDRFERPIASLAVLADDNTHWRPDRFESDALGCRHHFEFPVVKLIDYAPMIEALENGANPFALVTAAHLRARQTRHDANARYQSQLALVRRLYRREWDKQRTLDLFAILDWMMRLPDTLEQKLWENIRLVPN